MLKLGDAGMSVVYEQALQPDAQGSAAVHASVDIGAWSLEVVPPTYAARQYTPASELPHARRWRLRRSKRAWRNTTGTHTTTIKKLLPMRHASLIAYIDMN